MPPLPKKYTQTTILLYLFAGENRITAAPRFDQPTSITGIAVSDKTPNLTPTITPSCDCFYLNDPKDRRMGVGRALFERAKKLAYERGAYNIDLNVWAFNESAIRFYESLGMKPSRMNMEFITGKEKI